MRVALTGVSGFIGSAMARSFAESGHRVTGLVRETSRRDHVEAFVDRFVVGDHADDRAWADLLEGADCLVHNSLDGKAFRLPDLDRHLQSNVVASVRLIEAARPRQVVFISTIAVHHDMHPTSYNERGQGVIDEWHPLRPGSVYGAYKASVEAHLWADWAESGRNLAAIRPCGVYGMDPDPERRYGVGLVRKLRAGQAIRKPGGGKFVHVEDVAAVADALIGNDAAAGRAFNLVDCYARWSDWATYAAEIMGVDADIDASSPAEPKNVFSKDAVRELGVPLDRGHDSIRAYLRELIEHEGG